MVTDRQLQVLDLVAGGLTDGEIATKLGIGVPTVRTHIRTIREKAPPDLPFDVGTRAGLVRYRDWLQRDRLSADATNPRVPILVIRRLGDDAVARPLLRERYSIGRSRRADFVLDSPYVSSNHARLIEAGGTWAIEDARSKNGTRFNGELMDPGVPTPLRATDTVTIGEFSLTLVERATEGPTKTLQ